MARLPQGARITDYISLGVIAKTFPVETVKKILAETGRASRRERDLPAHVMIYYVIALALYMHASCREVLRSLLEGIEWLREPGKHKPPAGKSAISQARTRLGPEPVRRLHDALVGPIAHKETPGAWYRRWRLTSLDGSTLDVADTAQNRAAFGRPGASRGTSASPQIRFVSLAETGTHVLFGSELGGVRTGEITLAREVVAHLRPGMVCLADRNFLGWRLWNTARATGADLLWRAKRTLRLPLDRRLPDGSYLSRIYPSERARRTETDAAVVRVIEYRLDGVAEAEPFYRLVTSILEPGKAPAEELAALYHERWEFETALDELKTHLRGARLVLRSKTPPLVRQEFYGLMMAHFAIRALMHEAALKAEVDPDTLSYVHAVRVIRRKLPRFASVPPSAPSGVSRRHAR
jgi:hypothetical protein